MVCGYIQLCSLSLKLNITANLIPKLNVLSLWSCTVVVILIVITDTVSPAGEVARFGAG